MPQTPVFQDGQSGARAGTRSLTVCAAALGARDSCLPPVPLAGSGVALSRRLGARGELLASFSSAKRCVRLAVLADLLLLRLRADSSAFMAARGIQVSAGCQTGCLICRAVRPQAGRWESRGRRSERNGVEGAMSASCIERSWVCPNDAAAAPAAARAKTCPRRGFLLRPCALTASQTIPTCPARRPRPDHCLTARGLLVPAAPRHPAVRPNAGLVPTG